MASDQLKNALNLLKPDTRASLFDEPEISAFYSCAFFAGFLNAFKRLPQSDLQHLLRRFDVEMPENATKDEILTLLIDEFVLNGTDAMLHNMNEQQLQLQHRDLIGPTSGKLSQQALFNAIVCKIFDLEPLTLDPGSPAREEEPHSPDEKSSSEGNAPVSPEINPTRPSPAAVPQKKLRCAVTFCRTSERDLQRTYRGALQTTCAELADQAQRDNITYIRCDEHSQPESWEGMVKHKCNAKGCQTLLCSALCHCTIKGRYLCEEHMEKSTGSSKKRPRTQTDFTRNVKARRLNFDEF